MIRAFDLRAHEGIDLLVRLHVGAGLNLPSAIAVEGRLREDLPRQAHAGAHFDPIVRLAQVVETNARLLERIGRGQSHPAAALGAHRSDMGLKAVLLRERRAVVGHRHGQEVILDVRIGDARAAADEPAGLEMIGRPQAILAQQPACADQRAIPPVDRGVQGDRLLARHLEIKLQVILQVLADARQIVHHLDAERAQLRRRPHSGQLQQLRRVDGAARENQLRANAHAVRFASAAVLDAAGAPALEKYARRKRMRQHLEVGALHGGAQVGARGAAAPAPLHGHVHAAEAFLLKTVDVRRPRIARLAGGAEPCRMQRIVQASIGRVQLAAAAAVLVAALRALLGALEVGQHIAVRPARGALGRPALEILRIAADVDQPVDRG